MAPADPIWPLKIGSLPTELGWTGQFSDSQTTLEAVRPGAVLPGFSIQYIKEPNEFIFILAP